MKRKLAATLIITLLLTGCSSGTEAAPKAALQTEKETLSFSRPHKESLPPAEPEDTSPSQPEETIPPESQEQESAQQPAAPQAQSKPQQTTKPAQTTTQQTTSKPATTSKPTTSGRPTSSATCKDTGSSKIWEDPDADKPDLYEVKQDPTRAAYQQWLKTNGNPYFFYIDTDGFYMHPGRVYGVPLITSYEIFMDCTWSCSDPSVASVNEYGYVVPLNPGVAILSVSHTDPQTQETTTRQCEVTVRNYPVYTMAQLEQRAHEEAKKIADYAMHYQGADTDLERIAVAAGLVYQYVKVSGSSSITKIVDGELVSCSIPGYNQPFGTLVTFHSSCAGDTRALGLVLEYMGFQWYHTNANQWDHQWCVVYDVDGQTAYADCSTYGIVGYGQRPENIRDGLVFRGGELVPL